MKINYKNNINVFQNKPFPSSTVLVQKLIHFMVNGYIKLCSVWSGFYFWNIEPFADLSVSY